MVFVSPQNRVQGPRRNPAHRIDRVFVSPQNRVQGPA